MWGIILAVALAPVHARLASMLGGRDRLAATAMSLAGLAMLLLPASLISVSLLNGAREVTAGVEDGTLAIPSVPENVADWPLVGEDLSEIWGSAHDDLEAMLVEYAPKVAGAVDGLVRTAGGIVLDILLFALSILVAGVLLATGERGGALALKVGSRMAGERGAGLVQLATATMRSVAQGVVGIAVIQAVAGWIGMAVVGVPGAPVWALVLLLLAVMQLSPILVLGPAAYWVFQTGDTLPAVLFLVWSIVVSVSDTFLKPMFLGRGVSVPMLVILLGAIGGLMSAGIAGLFVGAVGLAVGYTVFIAWLEQDDEIPEGDASPG